MGARGEIGLGKKRSAKAERTSLHPQTPKWPWTSGAKRGRGGMAGW